MRKVVLFMHTSLDGYTSGPNGEMDWIVVDDEIWGAVIDLQNTADTALFGRVNYQGFEGFWPTAAADPASGPFEVSHSQWLNQSAKIVFSNTLEQVNWQNTRIVRGDIAEEIARLKRQPGKDLLLFGGAGIATTFMNLGRVDEIRLNVDPILLGGGSALFGGLDHRLDLRLVESRQFNSGVVGLHYEAKRG